MKHATLTAALLLSSGLVQAHADKHGVQLDCDVGSDYSVGMQRRAFLFTQDSGKPGEIGIGGGRLFIDGREETLTVADHQRLRQLELQMQQLVPELQRVAVDAIDIAFTALSEVARGLSNNPQATISSLESAHQRARSEMNAKPLSAFSEDAMTDVVRPIITEFLPDIVGGAVSSAVRAAFGGEKKSREFEARMNRMEHELDTKVEARATALEPLVDAMCGRLRRMDEIDNALEFRLPDGQPLQLLRVDRREKN